MTIPAILQEALVEKDCVCQPSVTIIKRRRKLAPSTHWWEDLMRCWRSGPVPAIHHRRSDSLSPWAPRSLRLWPSRSR
eukprot:795886-Heterocapsa_arctica.AAC.1